MTHPIVRLHIEGMSCPSCAHHVRQALQAVPGVAEVRLPDWRDPHAEVILEAAVPGDTLVQAVAQAGYRAAVEPHATSAAAPPRPATAFAPPRTTEDAFDLVVLGGGSGGFAAAIQAAEMGARVAMVNDGLLGGTCVNIGCVPSKALIRAAAAWHQAEHHPFRGVHTRAERLDWAAVRAHKDELVASLRREKYEDVLAAYPQITFLAGRGRLTPQGHVQVGERLLKTARVVIATGARPRILDLPGVSEAEPLTSTSLMSLERLPASLIVLGGRAVALELAQTMARFGVQVTLLQRSPRILPEHEPEIGAQLAAHLEEEGLRVITGVRLEALGREGDQRVVYAQVNGRRQIFHAEQVLMAVGRQANTEHLGLEALSIATTPNGNIVVDETLRTTHPQVYAVGDCTTLPQFVYVAAAAGKIAALNALGDVPQTLDLSVLPTVVFTDPQAAAVGLTEAQAREAGYAIKTSLLPLSAVPRALAARDTRGFIKLVADAKSDRLLGVHLLAAEGGEVVQSAAIALRAGLRTQDLRAMFFPYLTQVEGLKLAALALEKDISKLSCCAG